MLVFQSGWLHHLQRDETSWTYYSLKEKNGISAKPRAQQLIRDRLLHAIPDKNDHGKNALYIEKIINEGK